MWVHIPTLVTAQVHKIEGHFEPLLGVNCVLEHPGVEDDDRYRPDPQETYYIYIGQSDEVLPRCSRRELYCGWECCYRPIS